MRRSRWWSALHTTGLFRKRAICCCLLTFRQPKTLKQRCMHCIQPAIPQASTLRPSSDRSTSHRSKWKRQLKLFLSASAGPSDLRPLHLSEMLRSNEKRRVLESWSGFCSILVNGRFSSEAMSILTASRLVAFKIVAFKKPLGGIRPVAVGETFGFGFWLSSSIASRRASTKCGRDCCPSGKNLDTRSEGQRRVSIN